MTWIEERLRLLGLFALAALLPLAVCLLLAGLGAYALATPMGWGGGLRWVAGGLGLTLGVAGLGLAGKSWPAPKGPCLDPEVAPELRTGLRTCSASWRGPGTGAVILDAHAWGADLVGTPRLGLLGWTRFHWVIGVYPLLALSAREWEALLSWEAVWWSNQQSWLNLQVKRLVGWWQRLLAHCGDRGRGAPWWGPLVRPGARWMVQRLDPFLVRECLWTDAVVAANQGAATLARGLCRLALLQPLLERRILPDLERSCLAGQPLPDDLYGHLEEQLARCPEAAEGLLELALDGLVSQAPPLLRLRLRQLGVEPAVPLPPSGPALRHLLGDPALRKQLAEPLKQRIREHLRQLADRQGAADRRFRELGPRLLGWFPHHPHALEYLRLACDRVAPKDFRELLLAWRAAYPGHPEGRLLHVQWLLGQDCRLEARALIEQLVAQDPFLTAACHNLLAEHYRRRGDRLESEREWSLARRAEALAERARQERGSAGLGDFLEPHGCPQEQLAPMLRYLQALGGLGEAYLVRKKVALHPEHPVLLLVVRPRGAGWDPLGRKRDQFQARLARECPFPGRATGHVLVPRPTLLRRHRRTLEALGAKLLA